jgi:hypothetical protein
MENTRNNILWAVCIIKYIIIKRNHLVLEKDIKY